MLASDWSSPHIPASDWPPSLTCEGAADPEPGGAGATGQAAEAVTLRAGVTHAVPA